MKQINHLNKKLKKYSLKANSKYCKNKKLRKKVKLIVNPYQVKLLKENNLKNSH